MMDPVEALENRIWRLERRLAKYHERLEESLDNDRRLQLGITWEIAGYALSWGVFWVTFKAIDYFFPSHGYGLIVSFLTAVSAFTTFSIAVVWVSKKHQSDEKKLSQLPNWYDVS